MFEFLFKYPIDLYQRGNLVLDQQSTYLIFTVFVAAGLLFWLGFRGRSTADWKQVLVLPLFRTCSVALIVFLLADPKLEVMAEKQQQNLVAVLVDDSYSMQINDSELGSRAEQVRQWLGMQSGSLMSELDSEFATRLYAFGSRLNRIETSDDLGFQSGETDYAQALESLQESLSDQPLAGIVLLSDGVADNNPELEASLRKLRQREIPIYPVKVGQAVWQRDIELSRFEVPANPLIESLYAASLEIRQHGFQQQTVELTIENDSQILYREEVVLNEMVNRLEIPLPASEAGSQRLRASLTPKPDEMLAANNSRETVINIDPRPRRVLYFEGEPRFEFKFIRRALEQDEAIHLNGLVRTADARYLRTGIETRDLLQDGFPQTAEELFDYDAVILGNVSTGLLNREQQGLLVDFVERRGGGLLLLGGQSAFSEGGYQDSLLGELMPVVLPRRAQPGFRVEAKIQPTEQFDSFPALHLSPGMGPDHDNWRRLPPLTLVNPLYDIKPGARLLLSAEHANISQPLVAMASQYYGKGRVVAFPVQNSWFWQMHHEIDAEDQTHERLWQQLVRWLAVDSQQSLSLNVDSVVAAGSELTISATAFDDNFNPENQAAPALWLSSPGETERRIEMARHPSIEGRWQAQIETANLGDYWLRTDATDAGSAYETRVIATRTGSEFHQAQRNDKTLGQLASSTGGQVIDTADWDALVKALNAQQRGTPVLQRHELWDMPFLFLLLFALLLTDWALRRRLGLL